MNLRRRDHAVRDAAFFRRRDNFRVERIEDHLALTFDELLIGNFERVGDLIRIIQKHAQITDASHA